MTAIPQTLGMPVAQGCWIAPSQGTSMQPATIICQNNRETGTPCGETALIHGVQYVYSRAGSEPASHVLREAHYTIDCPRCGRLMQVEKYQ